MDFWGSIKKVVAGAAPVLASAILPGSGLAVGLLSRVFGTDPADEKAMLTAVQNATPEQWAELKKAELGHEAKLAEIGAEVEITTLKEVNATFRAELASSHGFARNWRPYYGYCVATAWFIQMLGFTIAIMWVMIKNPTELAAIVTAIVGVITSLTALWGIALAVLGVSVHKRSKDKEIASGVKPMGLIQSLVNKVS